MTFKTLEHDRATASFDAETRIAMITYSGQLTAEASAAVYEWLNDLIRTLGSKEVYGEIFDFRMVTEFMPDNLMDARKNSRRLNLRQEAQSIPVAMIVKDFYQEEILRGPMQNVPENVRKTIVKSVEEAYDFFARWHETRSTQT